VRKTADDPENIFPVRALMHFEGERSFPEGIKKISLEIGQTKNSGCGVSLDKEIGIG